MDKMAVCILAHTDGKQLKRLIHSLDSPYFDVFVHVDADSPGLLTELVGIKLSNSSLHVIDHPVRVAWGDYSQVEAILSMYREVLSSSCQYSRAILLSGLDYPIASNRDIFESLSNEREQIAGYEITDKSLDYKVATYHFMKHQRVVRVFLRTAGQALGLKKPRTCSIDGKACKIWFAPTWTALSHDCIQYVVDTIDRNPELVRYFRTAYTPDELMIPTIVFNSPFKSVATVLDNSRGQLHYNDTPLLHYLNYEPVIEVFDETSFDAIVSSRKLFVRKVRSGVSDKLVDMLDERRG